MKNKKIVIIICLIIFFLCLFFLSPYLLVNISLYGDKNMIINYGETFSEPGYKGKIFNKSITDKVKVVDNLKHKIGKYKVIYSYKFWLTTIKAIRTVEIKDMEAPIIKLKGDKDYEVVLGTTYNDPGFIATDNYDGDLTNNVKLTGKVDVNTLGEYRIKYEVSDSFNNNRIIFRNVKVVRKNPITMSISEYTLDGWYDESKLKLTENKGEEYFNSIKMIGDSNVMLMYQWGVLAGNNAWGIPCLHAESMFNTELNIYGFDEKILLIDAVKKYKPQRLIINFGTFSTSWIGELVFIEKAEEVIKEIQKIVPNSEIGLISIYPITKDYDKENVNKFKQSTINKYNFLILQMANKYNVKYLDVQEVLKDNDGYLNKIYDNSEGYHLNYAGYKKVKEYIMTHSF